MEKFDLSQILDSFTDRQNFRIGDYVYEATPYAKVYAYLSVVYVY